MSGSKAPSSRTALAAAYNGSERSLLPLPTGISYIAVGAISATIFSISGHFQTSVETS